MRLYGRSLCPASQALLALGCLNGRYTISWQGTVTSLLVAWQPQCDDKTPETYCAWPRNCLAHNPPSLLQYTVFSQIKTNEI